MTDGKLDKAMSWAGVGLVWSTVALVSVFIIGVVASLFNGC